MSLTPVMPKPPIRQLQDAAESLPDAQVIRIARVHIMETGGIVTREWDQWSEDARRFLRPHFDPDAVSGDMVREGHVFCGDTIDSERGFINPGVRVKLQNPNMALALCFWARVYVHLARAYDSPDTEWKGLCRKTQLRVMGELQGALTGARGASA